MSESTTPMQRRRDRLRAEGHKQVELWLTPQGQARRERLQQPTETLDEFIDRAIAALEALEQGQPVRPLRSEILGVTGDTALPVAVRESILHEVRRVLASDALWQELLHPRLTQTLSQLLPRMLPSDLAVPVQMEPRAIPSDLPSDLPSDVPSSERSLADTAPDPAPAPAAAREPTLDLEAARRQIIPKLKAMREKKGPDGKPPSYEDIAEQLTAEGVPPLRGERWHKSVVHSLLRKFGAQYG